MTEDDDMLENDLRRAAEFLDPVPAALLDSAVAAFTLRSLDAELATLTFDSLAEAAAVRSGGGVRVLGFSSGEHQVEVELSFTDGSGRLVGAVEPPEPAEVVVEGASWSRAVRADALGRFTCAGLASGPLSLRVRLAAGELRTEWITA
ncbi:hypothetical protein [Nonomuraea sp. NPDC050310]|uniref:hypothetical protein n=1 Tax=unclassified Nonomuraea TaxID=2593643 RepID=UPI0033E6C608